MAKLEQFTAATATTELKSGVLNADTLTKLSSFIATTRKEQSDNTLALQNKLADAEKQLNTLQQSRSELAQGASTTLREAVLLVETKATGGNVRLSYLVDSATWAPSYTIKATTSKEKVKVYYQAMVSQLSGEDWKDVKMTLSTATPSVVALAPKLDPLTLALSSRGARSNCKYGC